MKNVSDKIYREIQNTHFTLHDIFPRRVPFMRLCRKIGGVRQVTDDSIIGPTFFASWINMLQTHTQNMKYLLFFHSNNVLRTVLSITFMRALSVFAE